jgi:hypothetical protein
MYMWYIMMYQIFTCPMSKLICDCEVQEASIHLRLQCPPVVKLVQRLVLGLSNVNLARVPDSNPLKVVIFLVSFSSLILVHHQWKVYLACLQGSYPSVYIDYTFG